MKRLVTEDKLCWECDNQSCGQEHCGWITVGWSRWEYKSKKEIVGDKVVNAYRFATTGDPSKGDFWFCNDPWTNRLYTGPM